MVMALTQYLKETADFALLDEHVPFLNTTDPCAAPTETATVWDHALRAQRHLLCDLGRHGLCRIRYGDWCDTMNGVGARGEGESVMLSMSTAWGCGLLAELAEHIGQQDVAGEMRLARSRLVERIRACAWDGNWFVRAFDDDGVAVGSAKTADRDDGEGRIFLNPQSWAMIAGIADEVQVSACVSAGESQLDTGYGMVLHAPPFTRLRPRIGQMTAMTPGFYENGSVYVHGTVFWIAALAMANRPDDAWRAFQAVLPTTPNKPASDTEPFVIPNYYIGPACDRRKQKNLYLSGWRTGSAAWLYMTAIEWILGARAEYDGLRIDPRLPSGWTQARIVRPFRGDTYDIRISRPSGAGQRIAALRLDGAPVPPPVIPPALDGATHLVEVELG
jgi:cellobiose phosphorylase